MELLFDGWQACLRLSQISEFWTAQRCAFKYYIPSNCDDVRQIAGFCRLSGSVKFFCRCCLQRSIPHVNENSCSTREGQLTCFPARGREGDELFPWDLFSLSPSSWNSRCRGTRPHRLVATSSQKVGNLRATA